MQTTRTRRTVVEHVVETDARGNQRIGARRVVDAGDPPSAEERVDESARQTGERARLSGR
jgi:guanyl-specific ribonuclease Sa